LVGLKTDLEYLKAFAVDTNRFADDDIEMNHNIGVVLKRLKCIAYKFRELVLVESKRREFGVGEEMNIARLVVHLKER